MLHAGTGAVPAVVLRTTRAWPDEDWATATATLERRGLVEANESLTDAGQTFREALERRTDELALSPWRTLGEQGCEELRTLVRPWSRAIVSTRRVSP